MPTSLHIPKPLLDAVDSRARSLGMSRDRFIVLALDHELGREAEWSPKFFDVLAKIDREDARAIDGMLAAVRARRTCKRRGNPFV